MEKSDAVVIWLVIAVLAVYILGVLFFFPLHVWHAYFGKRMRNRFLGSRIDTTYGPWSTIKIALTLAVLWPRFVFWKIA